MPLQKPLPIKTSILRRHPRIRAPTVVHLAAVLARRALERALPERARLSNDRRCHRGHGADAAAMVELTGELPPGPLVSDDLAPTTIRQRTWNLWHIASLWVGMSVCIPTYMLASSMISAGMTWRQSILAIVLGNAIVLVPIDHPAHMLAPAMGSHFQCLREPRFSPRGAILFRSCGP